jgi:flagellar basal-body rod modification protein FlgD
MATTSGTSATTQTSTTTKVYENPKGKLGGEEFLKMFLTELKYQDPTEPMDNEKILEQTSQLSMLETNENLQTSLKSMATALASSSNFSVISAIGKTANTGTDAIAIEDGKGLTFDVHFASPIQSGNLNIINSNGQVVKTLDLSSKAGQSGTVTFNWDAIDDTGSMVNDGNYKVISNYLDSSGNLNRASYGVYPIESVKFSNGEAMLKLGSKYYSINDVAEIY